MSDATLNSKNLLFLFVVIVTWATACATVVESYYEESVSYAENPHCKPSELDTGIQCSDVGPRIKVQGLHHQEQEGLYSNYELHFLPLASAYFVARMADTWGYQHRCPTNKTFLRELDMLSPWSGTVNAIALDGACGYTDVMRRICTPSNDEYPSSCEGYDGTPGTYGKRLETLSYISILQGANLRWTLFINCWRAKTPENPNSEEIATSFSVFNLDPELSAADRALVLDELKKRGFNTDPSNLIEFDYSTTGCS